MTTRVAKRLTAEEMMRRLIDRELVEPFSKDEIEALATGLDRDVPNYDTIAVYRWFQQQGNEMWVWSGGGEDYARMWGEKLGLNAADRATDA